MSIRLHRRLGIARLAVALTLVLVACAGRPPDRVLGEADRFKPAAKSDRVEFLDAKALADLEAGIDPVYRVGMGDVLGVQVIGRAELSGRHTVGPDGRITVPVAGAVKVADLSREEAARAVGKALDRYYVKPAVVLGVEQYTSHRVTVLGRVQVPGQLAFDHAPTLLEALAKAGSLPVIDKQATLTRCAIFRGRDRIIWVDLKRLLNGGETAYNIRLAKGDLVYIPDSSDTMVYVLGSVHRPGAYRLTPDMSVMDALAQAGGPNDDGNSGRLGIYRPGRQLAETISLANLYKSDRRVNFSLEEGDVVYVPKSGLAEFGYVSRQLAAGLSLLTISTLLGL